jgi:hypothetical protein
MSLRCDRHDFRLPPATGSLQEGGGLRRATESIRTASTFRKQASAVTIHWVIDSRSRLVVVTAEGKVTWADFEEYLEVVTGAGANGYAKIFDGTHGENAMTREDMLALAARFREMHAEPHGPLAIVLQPDRQARLEPVLGALAAADRPLRLFATMRAAQTWIKTLATTRAKI